MLLRDEHDSVSGLPDASEAEASALRAPPRSLPVDDYGSALRVVSDRVVSDPSRWRPAPAPFASGTDRCGRFPSRSTRTGSYRALLANDLTHRGMS